MSSLTLSIIYAEYAIQLLQGSLDFTIPTPAPTVTSYVSMVFSFQGKCRTRIPIQVKMTIQFQPSSNKNPKSCSFVSTVLSLNQLWTSFHQKGLLVQLPQATSGALMQVQLSTSGAYRLNWRAHMLVDSITVWTTRPFRLLIPGYFIDKKCYISHVA